MLYLNKIIDDKKEWIRDLTTFRDSTFIYTSVLTRGTWMIPWDRSSDVLEHVVSTFKILYFYGSSQLCYGGFPVSDFAIGYTMIVISSITS